jgi:tRNA(fMet)-specific endonuclease VapC
MNATFMLDTSTASYILKGRSPKARRKFLRASVEDEVCISALSEGEFRYGLAKRQLSVEMRTAVEEFLSKINVLAWDSLAAQTYGRVRAEMERAGKPIATMDLLIAAHATAEGAVLVTSDRAMQDFCRRLDLTPTANWADDVGAKP